MPRFIKNPKIACLDFSLQKTKMHLGISVVVDDPTKLEAIRREYVKLEYSIAVVINEKNITPSCFEIRMPLTSCCSHLEWATTNSFENYWWAVVLVVTSHVFWMLYCPFLSMLLIIWNGED